jgi:hypothetical protein
VGFKKRGAFRHPRIMPLPSAECKNMGNRPKLPTAVSGKRDSDDPVAARLRRYVAYPDVIIVIPCVIDVTTHHNQSLYDRYNWNPDEFQRIFNADH